MTDDTLVAEAKVNHGSKLSLIWIVPLAALLIGIWMVYANWAQQGPLIEITFLTAEGIEAGKTKVKIKNVEVGEVLNVHLSKEAKHVVLTVRMEKSESHLLRKDSTFWVVRPRVGTGEISGLSTLLSGAYIEVARGKSKEFSKKFTGLETPPVTPFGTPGLHITLDSDGNKALKEGDSILFRGTVAGTIEYVHFNSEERRTYYNAFIAAPYDRLITTNTRFWFSSGVALDVSAEGVRLELASLSNLISGGVSFDVPTGQPPGDLVAERSFFRIYQSESAIYEKQYDHVLPYMVLFNDSIRGLTPGAPVEYRGIKVGQVVRTDTDYPEIQNLLESNSKIPVLIEIIPARLGYPDTSAALQLASKKIDELIAGGLRGGLSTGSFLTGQKFIDLQYDPKKRQGHTDTFATYTVIPSLDGQFGQLLNSVESTLDKVNRLPIEDIAQNINAVLSDARKTLAELRDSADQIQAVVSGPETREITDKLNQTLSSVQKFADDYSEGSATQMELQRSLRRLDQTLREFDPLLKNLRRKPNSLIFGGAENADPEPTGAYTDAP